MYLAVFKRTGWFILLFVGLNTLFAQSDPDESDKLSLKELLNVNITTVSKTIQAQDQAPATVIVITRNQIKMRGYRSLLDLIVDLPDIKVDDKIYPESRSSVVIRGTQGQQNFIILLDGVKISSPTNEALPIMENYPMHLAEQVEIVYGPASALYGADAVSGIINIITRKVSMGKDLAIDAASSAGSHGYTNNTLFISKRLNDHSRVVVSGQYYYDEQPDLSRIYKKDSMLSIGHYKEGTFNTFFGPMTPSKPVTPKYEAPAMAYNIYAALHLGDFSLSFFRNHSRLSSGYSNNTQNTVYNKDAFIAQSLSSLSAIYKKQLGRFTSTSSLIGTSYELNPESNYRNLYTGLDPAYKYAHSSTVRAEEQLDYRISKALDFTGGLTYEFFNAIPLSGDLIAPVNTGVAIAGSYAGTQSFYKPEGLPAHFYSLKYANKGCYLQARYSPLRELVLTLGARYDHNSRYGKTFNPRLGVVYQVNAKTSVKALYGTAFLAPSPTAAYAQWGAIYTQDSGKTYSSPFLHLPNPGLEPITSQNLELNIQHYLTDDFTLTLNGYYTFLTGLYFFADDNKTTHLYNNVFNGIPVDYVEVFVNGGKQKNYGGSLRLNLKQNIGDVSLNSFASFSYSDGIKYDSPDLNNGKNYSIQLPFISSVMFKIGSEIKAGKFSCSPRIVIAGKQNLPGISDTSGTAIRLQTLPGYALLNVSARYEITKKLAVFATVTNALNQRYRGVSYNMDLNVKNTDLFYGQPQEPIRVLAGLNLTF